MHIMYLKKSYDWKPFNKVCYPHKARLLTQYKLDRVGNNALSFLFIAQNYDQVSFTSV